jgi:ABC-2 type transport system permease protein
MLAYSRFEATRTLRNPRFLVLVGIVPVLLYLVGLHTGRGPANLVAGIPAPLWFLASSATLGALAAALTGSAARLAAERASGWTRQLRVTPLTEGAWLGGRILATVAIVIPVVVVIAALAVTVGGVRLGVAEWLQLLVTLLLGSLPIALIGLLVGLTLRAETAQAALAVVFIALAFAGGVFAQSPTPPPGLQLFSDITPSYYLVRLSRDAVLDLAPPLLDVGVLTLISAILAGAVVWLRRRSAD